MARKPKPEKEVAEFRKQIVSVATRLFSEKGPTNVSMREIASAVGVSAMTPYLYFADRDALLDAVRVAALSEFADRLTAAAEGDSPIEASRAISQAYVDFASREPGKYRLLFDYPVPDAPGSPELVAATERAKRTMTEYIGPLVDAGMIAGDREMIGMMFWTALHGTLVLERSGALGNVDGGLLRRTMAATIFRGLRRFPTDA